MKDRGITPEPRLLILRFGNPLRPSWLRRCFLFSGAFLKSPNRLRRNASQRRHFAWALGSDELIELEAVLVPFVPIGLPCGLQRRENASLRD